MKRVVKQCLVVFGILSITVSHAFAVPLYPATVLADDPVAYWRLGELDGITAHDEQGTHNGTYVSATLGAPGLLAGESDMAIGLGSGSSRVNVSPFPMPTTALSVEFWMLSSATNTGTPFSYSLGTGTLGNEFLLYNYNNLSVYINSQVMATGLDIADGNANHIVTTWQSADGALKVYKNSVLAFSATHQAGSPISAGGYLVFGQEQDSLGGGFYPFQRFIGTLDEVAVYDAVLSADQVFAHHQASLASTPEPGTLVLMGTGLLGILGYSYRRWKKA